MAVARSPIGGEAVARAARIRTGQQTCAKMGKGPAGIGYHWDDEKRRCVETVPTALGAALRSVGTAAVGSILTAATGGLAAAGPAALGGSRTAQTLISTAQRVQTAAAPVVTLARSSPVATLVPTVSNVLKTVAQTALNRSSSSMVTSAAPAALTTAARAGGVIAAAGAIPAVAAAAGRVAGAASGIVSTIQRLVPGGATGVPSTNATCPPGTIRGPLGTCIDLLPGGQTSGGGIFIGRFDPIMGRYGAGVLPERENRLVHICPPGMVLGKDEICYTKGQVGRSGRKHNPGFRPPITGGDVSAIRRAAAAKKRVAKLGRGVGLFVANRRPESCKPKKK